MKTTDGKNGTGSMASRRTAAKYLLLGLASAVAMVFAVPAHAGEPSGINLYVKIVSASNIAGSSSNQNPYVRVQQWRDHQVTAIQWGDNNPTWNEEIFFADIDPSKPFKWRTSNEFDDETYGRGEIDMSEITYTNQIFTMNLDNQGTVTFVIRMYE